MKAVLQVVLPWPGRALSPNASHRHWSEKRRATNAYRDTAYVIALEVIRSQVAMRGPRPEGELRVAMKFCPPTNRRRDQDNLIGSMKWGLDGLARALQMNDSKFRLDEPEIGELHEGGAVIVRIYQKDAIDREAAK